MVQPLVPISAQAMGVRSYKEIRLPTRLIIVQKAITQVKPHGMGGLITMFKVNMYQEKELLQTSNTNLLMVRRTIP